MSTSRMCYDLETDQVQKTCTNCHRTKPTAEFRLKLSKKPQQHPTATEAPCHFIADQFNNLCNACHFKQLFRLQNLNGIIKYSGLQEFDKRNTRQVFLEEIVELDANAKRGCNKNGLDTTVTVEFEGDLKEWFGLEFDLNNEELIENMLNETKTIGNAHQDTTSESELTGVDKKMIDELMFLNQNFYDHSSSTLVFEDLSLPRETKFKDSLTNRDIKNLSKLINKQIVAVIQKKTGYRFITSNASKSKSQQTYYKKFICHGDRIRGKGHGSGQCENSLIRVTYYENSHYLRIVYQHQTHSRYLK